MSRRTVWTILGVVALTLVAGAAAAQEIRPITIVNPVFMASGIGDNDCYSDVSDGTHWIPILGWETQGRQYTGLMNNDHPDLKAAGGAPHGSQVAYTDGKNESMFRQFLPDEVLEADTLYTLMVDAAHFSGHWGGYADDVWWGNSIQLWVADSDGTGGFTSYKCLVSEPLIENPGLRVFSTFTLTFDSSTLSADSDLFDKVLEIRLVGGQYEGRVAFDRVTMTAETIVPEPATMGLLALGGLAMLRRRR